MDVRLLPMGDSAVLVEVADTDAALALRQALRAHVDGHHDPVSRAVDELVVGARTVLVRASDPSALGDLAGVVVEVAGAPDVTTGRPSRARVVEVPVHYDGPDLDEVARLTGLTREEVVRAHTGSPWRVG